jgi:uncharacterized protein
MIRGLTGHLSVSDTIGLGPTDTVTLMTDGSLEALDVLRIAGAGGTASNSNVRNTALQGVQSDAVWHEMRVPGFMRRRSPRATAVH